MDLRYGEAHDEMDTDSGAGNTTPTPLFSPALPLIPARFVPPQAVPSRSRFFQNGILYDQNAPGPGINGGDDVMMDLHSDTNTEDGQDFEGPPGFDQGFTGHGKPSDVQGSGEQLSRENRGSRPSHYLLEGLLDGDETMMESQSQTPRAGSAYLAPPQIMASPAAALAEPDESDDTPQPTSALMHGPFPYGQHRTLPPGQQSFYTYPQVPRSAPSTQAAFALQSRFPAGGQLTQLVNRDDDPLVGPDVLIKDLPLLGIALAEFNSVPFNTKPFRDIPSIILAHLNQPPLYGPEPDWVALLSYFRTNQASHGFANLQDLHVFILRIVLPTAIRDNRRWMVKLYSWQMDLPVDCRLRYDAWNLSVKGRLHMAYIIIPDTLPFTNITDGDFYKNHISIPNHQRQVHSPRPIFRSAMVPDSAKFIQWLNTTPNPLHPGMLVPTQMIHRRSEIDEHMLTTEEAIRQLNMGDLLRKTTRILEIWWFVSHNNASLEYYAAHNWFGIEQEFI